MGTDLTMSSTQQHFDACLFNIIISLDCLLCEGMEILYVPVTIDESGTVYLVGLYICTRLYSRHSSWCSLKPQLL